MTERAAILGAAAILIGVALLQMFALHERHYKNRKWQLLEGRVSSLERIIVGGHE